MIVDEASEAGFEQLPIVVHESPRRFVARARLTLIQTTGLGRRGQSISKHGRARGQEAVKHRSAGGRRHELRLDQTRQHREHPAADPRPDRPAEHHPIDVECVDQHGEAGGECRGCTQAIVSSAGPLTGGVVAG